ncbi:Adenosylmethionine-8-amino-7-oxononanoate aminotransferase [Trichinella pseudospiralis]
MRLCGGVCVIDDHQTHVWKWSAENQLISTVFAAVQLLIVTASFAQHAYSMCNGEGVFNCQFNTTVAGKNHSQFLAVDVIVFDYGLFQQLLGTDKCVANHLDGGYMRFVCSSAASDRSARFAETSRLCAKHLFAWLDHLAVGHVAKNAFRIDQPFRRSFHQHIHLFCRNIFQLDIHTHPLAFLLVRESVATTTDRAVQKIHHVRINYAPLHLLN